MPKLSENVRFTPESGHQLERYECGCHGFAIEARCNRANGKCKVLGSCAVRREQRVLARHLEYQTSEYLRLFQRRHSRYYSWHALEIRSEVTLFTKVQALKIPMPIN